MASVPTSGPVTDWAKYDRALRQRARTPWLYLLAVALQPPPRRSGRRPAHRPIVYSDDFILALLMARTALQLTFRATVAQAWVILCLAGLDHPLPHSSHLARRAQALSADRRCWRQGQARAWVLQHALVRAARRGQSLWVLADSTGLSLCGPGAWRTDKPGADPTLRRTRTFAKLHALVDAVSGAVLVAILTDANTGDSTILPKLLDALPPPIHIRTLAADGAYDTRACYAAAATHHITHALIPPKEGARLWPAKVPGAALRAAHFGLGTASHDIIPGSPAWRMATGAGVRSLVETAFSVGHAQAGSRLRCRSPAGQATEVWLRLQVMNGAALDAPCPTTNRAASVAAAHADQPIVPPRLPQKPAPVPIQLPPAGPAINAAPWHPYRAPRRPPMS
jgi:hypothetical protein